MKLKTLFKTLLLLCFFQCASMLHITPSFAQENVKSESSNPQQRAADKKKAQKQKEGEKFYAKQEKKHLKDQTKETRKRMKESRKKADRVNSGKPLPFYKRWFRKKSKRN